MMEQPIDQFSRLNEQTLSLINVIYARMFIHYLAVHLAYGLDSHVHDVRACYDHHGLGQLE